MAKTASDSNAAPSKLGYLYQLRYSLLLALENGADPSRSISVEKLDDVSLQEQKPSEPHETAIKSYQLKHKIDRSGGTTNAHKDVWKTIRNWSMAITDGKMSLDACELLLVTTSTASSSQAICALRPTGSKDDREKARTTLETVGKNSTNRHVKSGYDALKKLPLKTRKKMFQSITLVEDSAQIDEVKNEIRKQIWMVADSDRQPAFVERLEGWWFDIVIEHLLDDDSYSIPLELVAKKIYSLVDQFKLDNLPDDLFDADVPDDEVLPNDPRNFVRQLESIGLGEGRIMKAQENQYKAATQRSRWIRDKMIDMEEIDKFELKLIKEWEEFFAIFYDGLLPDSLETQLCTAGGALYSWSQEKAPADPNLFIRPLFRSPYLTRGSFQMLADQVRIGWHIRYREKFGGMEDAA